MIYLGLNLNTTVDVVDPVAPPNAKLACDLISSKITNSFNLTNIIKIDLK